MTEVIPEVSTMGESDKDNLRKAVRSDSATPNGETRFCLKATKEAEKEAGEEDEGGAQQP